MIRLNPLRSTRIVMKTILRTTALTGMILVAQKIAESLQNFHSICVLLLTTASQLTEREWLAMFLFLLIFYLLLKVEIISMLLSFYFVGEYLKKYARRNIFIFFAWVVTGFAVFFNVEKSANKTYIFEACCSNVVSATMYQFIATC